MTRVPELIDLIVQGKNAEATDVLNSELLSRSYEAIGELRPHIAKEYFGSVADSVLDNEEEAEEVESEEQVEPEVTEEEDEAN